MSFIILGSNQEPASLWLSAQDQNNNFVYLSSSVIKRSPCKQEGADSIHMTWNHLFDYDCNEILLKRTFTLSV